VNAVRASNSLSPLKRSTSLDNAARYYSTDMGQDDYFGDVPEPHDTYDRSGGTLVWVCDVGTRIAIYYSPSWWGENIAAGYSTPQAVMDGWMNSPPHRANILSPNFWEIGVGYYTGSGSHAPYWTQDFGRQSGVYPLIVNGEAATTNSTSVSLYVYGSGDWDEMRLRNDSGAWTDWQSFQSTLSWTLNPGAGQHTVCVELRRGAQTVQSCDSIELSESAYVYYLPTVRKDLPSGPVTGWITIMAEDFEGSFPGVWQVVDYGSGAGEYYWGKRGCRPYTGSYSGWAVGGGANGAALSCGSNYPNDAESWMIYGPFSLADATAADLTFQLFLYSESGSNDYVFHGASINGHNFYGAPPASGDSGGWVQRTLDLTAVPTLGDLTGQSAVWIALVFGSDASVNYSEGAYVDDIVLRKYVPAGGQSQGLEPGSRTNALSQAETWILEAEAHSPR
jgi:hypothetical protein